MDRSYAYLAVVGTGDADLVTQHFGVNPTKAWSIGQVRPRGGNYPASRWSHERPEFENEMLDEALGAVIVFIESRQLDVANLPGDFEAYIQCVGYHKERSPGFHLSASLIQRLAALGVAVDFDLYCSAGLTDE